MMRTVVAEWEFRSLSVALYYSLAAEFDAPLEHSQSPVVAL